MTQKIDLLNTIKTSCQEINSTWNAINTATVTPAELNALRYLHASKVSDAIFAAEQLEEVEE